MVQCRLAQRAIFNHALLPWQRLPMQMRERLVCLPARHARCRIKACAQVMQVTPGTKLAVV